MMILIIGPMKSGKSLELIVRAEALKHHGKNVIYIKPQRDVRSESIISRLGLEVDAITTQSLDNVDVRAYDVIAIDEAHMFEPETTKTVVFSWLKNHKTVIVSGLNTDHAGRLMRTIAGLLELSPEVLINKQAACERCYGQATHTQVMELDGKVIDKLMSPEVPDDGTHDYEARCRLCFE